MDSAIPSEEVRGDDFFRGSPCLLRKCLDPAGNDMSMWVNRGLRYTQTDLPHLRGLTVYQFLN